MGLDECINHWAKFCALIVGAFLQRREEFFFFLKTHKSCNNLQTWMEKKGIIDGARQPLQKVIDAICRCNILSRKHKMFKECKVNETSSQLSYLIGGWHFSWESHFILQLMAFLLSLCPEACSFCTALLYKIFVINGEEIKKKSSFITPLILH